MAQNDFGKTWWGARWLDALAHTDYSNRLPRGRRYARGGRVQHTEIKNDTVISHVSGSRRQPYTVKLALKKFVKKEKDKIIEIVSNNPFYLTSLLARQVPEALDDEFKKHKIKIFPSSWRDIAADCSCPDWAACCKHIAAVIFIIANEIDKNPFLIFYLHGFDILSELEKRGLSAEKDAGAEIKRASDLFLPDKSECFKFDMAKIREIDFSVIPDIKEQLFNLLPDNPLFSRGKNFKLILKQAYKSFSRQAEKFLYLNQEKKASEKICTGLELIYDEKLNFLAAEFRSGEDKYLKIEANNFLKIIDYLMSLREKDLPAQHPGLEALRGLFLFALKLLEQGAYVPEIISLSDNDEYRIRLAPAELNAEVKNIFAVFSNNWPLEILINNGARRLPAREQIKTVLSEIMTTLIRDYFSRPETIKSDENAELFLHGRSFKTGQSFQDKEIANTIALWLSRFQITRKEYIPVLRIIEKGSFFNLDILADKKTDSQSEPAPLDKILSLKKYEKFKTGILKDLVLLSNYFPEIARIVESGGKEKLSFCLKEIEKIFFEKLPVFRMLGIPILLPRSLKELAYPRLGMKISEKKDTAKAVTYLSMADMLEFDYSVSLGNSQISFAEFKKLARGKRGLVKFRDGYIYLDEKEIAKIMKQAESAPRLSAHEKIQIVLSEDYRGAGVEITEKLRRMIRELFQAEKTALPAGLKAELRPYQRRGFEWLAKNSDLELGSLIADDMGLGKTVQIIALLLHLKTRQKFDKEPALVIVPTTLLTNWAREIDKFAPKLRYHIYHGAERKFAAENTDVFLSTYGLIRRDIEKFKEKEWGAVVVDEAQNIKNPLTEQTRAVKQLSAGVKIAMTGTPVENRLSEYWSIFDFLNKGYLGGLGAFNKDIAAPIERERDQNKLKRFRSITEPFILRRIKTDKTIIKDLPEKQETDRYCRLTKNQAALYQATTDTIMRAIMEKSDDGIERKGLVFKLMTALKQICNHPAQYLKKGQALPGESGKIEVLFEILDGIFEGGEKVLIFTQYAEMGYILENFLKERFGKQPLFLHGGLTRKKRDKMVDDFQNEPYHRAMILSLKAGGTGLNLTAANNVVHFDLWWNPAVENQATDRAFRIGQKRNVSVYRLISRGTFEEKINDMIRDKQDLADLTVARGEKWIGEYSNQELKNLFDYEKIKK